MNSGNHANGWSREEWDVELKDGTLLRLAYTGGDWVVEGLYETPAAPPARAFPLHVVP